VVIVYFHATTGIQYLLLTSITSKRGQLWLWILFR